MKTFPDVKLVHLPDEACEFASWVPDERKCVLILYDDRLPFLLKVLQAAGYEEPEEEIYLVRWRADESLDLTALATRLQVEKIVLFGQSLSSLGLHFTAADYFPIEVGGRTYMTCESLTRIESAKDEGNNKPAGALWRGIQQAFLCDKTVD